MVDDLIIRRAERAEAGILAGLAYVAWEAGILPLFAESSGLRDSERRRLDSYVGQCIERIIVAEHDGEIVGWCSRARGRSYVPYLFVVPFMQGQGIGSALLKRMESVLELEGFDRVHLETPADHVSAVRFYERQGYRILAMKADGSGQHGPLTSVRLEKRLDPFRGPITDIE